jgi:hypothetical protein
MQPMITSFFSKGFGAVRYVSLIQPHSRQIHLGGIGQFLFQKIGCNIHK